MPTTIDQNQVITNLNKLFDNSPNELNKLVLHNDDNVSFEAVIAGLMTVLKVTEEVAMTHAMEAHNSGKSILLSDDREKLLVIKSQLERYQLTLTIE